MMIMLLGMGAYKYYQSWSAPPEATERVVRDKFEQMQERLGLDPDKLKTLAEWAENQLSSSKMPGVVLAVARRGQLVYHQGFGASADAPVGLGRMTRSVLTAAVLSLVDEGVLALDEPVAAHLPEVANFRVASPAGVSADGKLATEPLSSPITLRLLLDDTCGLGCTETGIESANSTVAYCDRAARGHSMSAAPGSEQATQQLQEMAANVPLINQPGCSYRLGNGLDIAAHLACIVTKQSLDQLVHDRVLCRLRMSCTSWNKPAECIVPHRAVPRLFGSVGLNWTGEHKGHTSMLGWKVQEMPPTAAVVGAQLYSTATDMIAFQGMLLQQGVGPDGVRVLSVESVQFMNSDQLKQSLCDLTFNTHAHDVDIPHPSVGVGSPGQGVGAGVACVIVDPSTSQVGASKGSYCLCGLNGVEAWNDPTNELSVFCGTQLYPATALPQLVNELAATVYGAMLPPAASRLYVPGEAPEQGGMMANVMNMVMMMSMMGGPMAARM